MTDRKLWEAHWKRAQAAAAKPARTKMGKANEKLAESLMPFLQDNPGSIRNAIKNATRAGFARKEGGTKYHSRATHVDGIRFASQLEADRYKELKLLKAAGAIRWFLRQVPLDVAPGSVYRADFMTFNADGSIEFEDCKGLMTPASRVKIAVIEERYGIKIRILKRADVSR